MEKGYRRAAASMAHLLFDMENTAEIPRDEELAMKVLKEASDAGNVDSAFLLAQHMLNTPGADHAEAVDLLKRAAEPPHVLPVSAHSLGNLYLGESDTVAKDMQKAVTWWRAAAHHGFPPALGNVGAFRLNEVWRGSTPKPQRKILP